MKKLSILILALLYIGLANVNAQTDATTETVTTVEEVKAIKTCAKTGELCKETCKNKENGTCCQGKKTDSSCSKSNQGSFNFNKANDYGASKSSSCCKSKAKKECTGTKTTADVVPVEETPKNK